jgi:hypothetical protein
MEELKEKFNVMGENLKLQKIFAISFLVMYSVMVMVLIAVFCFGVVLSTAAIGMISSLVGYTSAKLNTIVDFLFGGSLSDKKEEKTL